MKNQISKKHNTLKSVIRTDEDKTYKAKDETSDNDSDSDSNNLEPYRCMECGKEFDEWEDFRDHLQESHMFKW